MGLGWPAALRFGSQELSLLLRSLASLATPLAFVFRASLRFASAWGVLLCVQFLLDFAPMSHKGAHGMSRGQSPPNRILPCGSPQPKGRRLRCLVCRLTRFHGMCFLILFCIWQAFVAFLWFPLERLKPICHHRAIVQPRR